MSIIPVKHGKKIQNHLPSFKLQSSDQNINKYTWESGRMAKPYANQNVQCNMMVMEDFIILRVY